MNLNPIKKIEEKDIKKVVQLDNRPNVSGGYGQAKLSAEQLKAWFDAYPAIVRQKVDDIISILSSCERSGDYIALRLERKDKDGSKITLDLSLYDLIESFANGSWADYFMVQTAQATESESLIACLNSILKTIGNSDTSDETVLGRLAHLEAENKTQATEIAENAKGIASNKAYAEQNTERIVKNETDIANTAKDITQINRRLKFVAGATLSVESNSEVAFEKITPTNAGTYATIEKIGCITVRNNNLCIADGYYELKDELDFVIKLGVLEPREYTFYFEGDFTGAAGISCSGATSTIDPRIDITSNTEFTLSVPEREDVSLYLYSVAADSDPEEPDWGTYPRLNGTITGIMLCNASDADKSYRPYLRSDNLCKADGRYDLSAKGETFEEQMIPLDLGVLNVGTYQLQWYGDIRNLYSISIDGDVSGHEYADFRNNYIIIEVLAESQVTVTLKSEWYEHGFEGGEAWDGVITGIMLVKIPDAVSPILNLKYEEKSGALWKAKPTGIESYTLSSNNILPKEQDKVHELTGKEDYSIPLGNLAPGRYYLSFEGNVSGYYEITILQEPYFQKEISFTVYDAGEVFFNIVSENIVDGNGVFLSGTIENIMLCLDSDSDKTYKPVSEPKIIDTISLPEDIEQGIKKAYEDKGVQRDCGWGLGVNADYNNHIEWRNGRIIYIQMLDEFDLANVREWKINSVSSFYTHISISPALKDLDFKVFTRTEVPIGLSSQYTMVTANQVNTSTFDKAISYFISDTKYITIRDSAYTDVDTFKEAMNGVKLVYALEAPIETDITHLFPNFSGYIDITTEAGGSVFAINKYSLPVPWTITYITKA